MKINILLSGIIFGITGLAYAGDAKTLKVVEKVEINAPANKVWSKVKDFGDLGAWHPAVAKTEITSGQDNAKGAVRQLTLQDGGKINEKLLAYSTRKMSYKYAILDGVLPVSHYVSSVTVKPMGNAKSVVVWQGNFERKDVSSTPAQGQDDETAVKTITSVYQGGLNNLKKISE